MLWMTLTSLFVALITSGGIIVLWRRLRKLERSDRLVSDRISQTEAVHSMELTLQSMLEELEAKNRSIMDVLDQREQTIRARQPDDRTNDVPPSATRASNGFQESVADESFDRLPDKTSRVLHLASKGYTTAAIAQRLGLGIGEVELIIDLNQKTS